MAKTGAQVVDLYIAGSPAKARPKLQELRKLIRAAAPKAEEKISYGMPFYEYHGRLVYFAGYKGHIGLYAAIPEDKSLAAKLKPYLAAKSTVQLPLDEPLPTALLTRVVKARVRENDAKAKAKA